MRWLATCCPIRFGSYLQLIFVAVLPLHVKLQHSVVVAHFSPAALHDGPCRRASAASACTRPKPNELSRPVAPRSRAETSSAQRTWLFVAVALCFQIFAAMPAT